MEMQMQMHKSALEDWLKVVFLVIWTINETFDSVYD